MVVWNLWSKTSISRSPRTRVFIDPVLLIPVATMHHTSEMIPHLGASLNEQHTAGLLWFTNLSWHIAGFVNIYSCLIFQNIY